MSITIETPAPRLVCEECGAQSEGKAPEQVEGWGTLPAVMYGEIEQWVHCPDCMAKAAAEAKREADIKAAHKSRVYPEDQYGNSFAWRCSCGKRDGGFVHRAYARDGWREAHDLYPEINYPLV